MGNGRVGVAPAQLHRPAPWANVPPAREPGSQKKLDIKMFMWHLLRFLLRLASKREKLNHCAGHTSISEGQLWPMDHQSAITTSQWKTMRKSFTYRDGAQGQPPEGIKPGAYYLYIVLTLQDEAIFIHIRTI